MFLDRRIIFRTHTMSPLQPTVSPWPACTPHDPWYTAPSASGLSASSPHLLLLAFVPRTVNTVRVSHVTETSPQVLQQQAGHVRLPGDAWVEGCWCPRRCQPAIPQVGRQFGCISSSTGTANAGAVRSQEVRVQAAEISGAGCGSRRHAYWTVERWRCEADTHGWTAPRAGHRRPYARLQSVASA